LPSRARAGFAPRKKALQYPRQRQNRHYSMLVYQPARQWIKLWTTGGWCGEKLCVAAMPQGGKTSTPVIDHRYFRTEILLSCPAAEGWEFVSA
jgi:hypothetical protein